MKKTKIMLAAIAVVAVVGGSLAFTAKTNYGFQTFYSDPNGGTNCSVPTTIFVEDPSGTLRKLSATTGTCTDIPVIVAE